MEPTNAFDSANGRVFKSCRILAVDDDDLVLMNTAAMLAELGHHVFEARSASQALEILDNTPVELVISDQAMPKMTGLQLAHAIRKRWPDLPVILATGYSEASVLADLTLPKIAKPFLQGDLDRAIRAVVTD